MSLINGLAARTRAEHDNARNGVQGLDEALSKSEEAGHGSKDVDLAVRNDVINAAILDSLVD